MAKRKSAYNAALLETQQLGRETVTPESSPTVTPSHSETVTEEKREPMPPHSDTITPSISENVAPLHSDTVTPSVEKDLFSKKVSFYLTAEQEEKLDDLAHDFKKQHHQRINRNDIVRYLIDTCTLETLDALKNKP